MGILELDLHFNDKKTLDNDMGKNTLTLQGMEYGQDKSKKQEEPGSCRRQQFR